MGTSYGEGGYGSAGDVIYPLRRNIADDEIFYISDTENFLSDTKTFLLKKLEENNAKLLVLVGDILSFFESPSSVWDLWHQSLAIEKVLEIDKKLVAEKISKHVEKECYDSLRNFHDFVKRCSSKDIHILYYTGNHDHLLNFYQMSREVPVMDKIRNHPNITFPKNLQRVHINNNLFITGLQCNKPTAECREYPHLKKYVESNMFPDPENTILVSHVPGTLKFKNRGSEEIRFLKSKFKFKCHYHGHVRDYNGEYLEEGIPTRSVHMDDK